MSTMKQAPTGFFYDPNGDLTRHKPVKAIWVEAAERKWFWQPKTFMVRLEYEDKDGWTWPGHETFEQAAEFRDKLISTLETP